MSDSLAKVIPMRETGVSQPLIEEWVRYLAGGHLSPQTLRLRRCLIEVLAEDYELATITADQLSHFIGTRPGGAWSRQGYLSTVRSFYRWLHLSGRRGDDPAALLHSIRTPRPRPRPVPAEIVEQALLVAGDETRLILLLGAYAGLRRAEIAGLHSDDVQGDYLVITGKGSVVRRVPIHPRLAPLLTFEGWAFPSVRRPGQHVTPEYIGNRATAALGEPWTAHSLRHLAATRWYAATRDIRATQALLGHASMAVTTGYVGIDDAAMRATVLAVA